MSLADYLINLFLVALVIRQMRGKHLTVFGLLWPVALVLYLGSKYIHNIPRSGNDLRFALIGALIGAVLGVLCAIFTHISRRVSDNKLIGRATSMAAMFWILGTGSRIAFALYATHGGGPAIGRFSVEHHLTGEDAWIGALLFMALAEVIGRSAVLALRAVRFERQPLGIG
jgi:hypothetical protein